MDLGNLVDARRRPITADDEPPIRVHADEGLVVIHPSGPADPDTTAALTDALNAAVAAGAVAVLDFDDEHASVPAPVTVPVPLPAPVDRGARPAVVATEPGCIRVATEFAWWTVDWSRRRLRCSEPSLPHRPARHHDWTGLCRLWVSATSVTALTASGACVSARR